VRPVTTIVAAAVILVTSAALYGCTTPTSGSSANHPRFAPLPSNLASTTATETTSGEAPHIPTGSSEATPPGKEGYKLVFQDEFDGTKVDSGTWEKLTPWGTRTTNDEQQYYDPANTEVVDGHLRIKIEKREAHGRDYASGIITSLNRPKFQYGYYEMRAKAPSGQGIWPAFWLTDDSTSEIDIFEMLGQDPRRLHATLHHTHDGKGHQHRQESVGADYSKDFHIFAVDWQPDRVVWYVDGIEYWRYEADHVPTAPMWIVVNTAVGGPWSGWPDETTQFPQEYLVDYIRAYEKN